jgi:CO/xanthine dehydrogenase Mo-binding subunit
MNTVNSERMNATQVSRRQLIKGTGALVVAITVADGLKVPPAAASLARTSAFAPRGVALESVDSWLVIHPHNNVTVYSGKIDSGTGVKTALAQIVAEELDTPFGKIKMIMGVTSVTPDQGITDASVSIQYGSQPLRAAAAEARRALLQLGSEHFGLPVNVLESVDGYVCVKGDRRKRASYGELIGNRRFDLSITIEKTPDFLSFTRRAKTDAPLKDPKEYKIVGTSEQRVDIPPKVTGQPVYLHDTRLPGMLHARVLRPRVDGPAVLTAIDEAAVQGLPGVVKLVRDGSFVGVIAEREFQAIRAVEKLRESAKWKVGDLPDYGHLYDHLAELPATKSVSSDGVGDPSVIPDGAAKVLEAQYRNPYQSHGSIGPSCAIAEYSDDRLTVWAATQSPYPLRAALAEVVRMPPEKIQVVYREGAGCYGQNGQDDVAGDAALLALAHPGRPIRVQWMRQDEFAAETKYPAMIVDIKGAVDAGGNVVLFDFNFRSGPHLARRAVSEPQDDGRSSLIGGWYKSHPLSPFWVDGAAFSRTHDLSTDLNPLYTVPNNLHKGVYFKSPLRSGELRAVGDFSVFFAVESFMDELSVAAARDPVDFRMQHLKSHTRRSDIVRETARLAKWRPHVSGKKLNGHGRGFALAYHGSYIGVVADVVVDRVSGEVHVRKIYAAVDVGLVINPDGLINQIEGGIIQAASRSLKEQVMFDSNGITSLDWATYPIFTFPEVPEVEVAIINRPDLPPAGAGELGSCPVAGAIANAIYDAVGARVREVPFTPDRVKAAMAT